MASSDGNGAARRPRPPSALAPAAAALNVQARLGLPVAGITGTTNTNQGLGFTSAPSSSTSGGFPSSSTSGGFPSSGFRQHSDDQDTSRRFRRGRGRSRGGPDRGSPRSFPYRSDALAGGAGPDRRVVTFKDDVIDSDTLMESSGDSRASSNSSRATGHSLRHKPYSRGPRNAGPGDAAGGGLGMRLRSSVLIEGFDSSLSNASIVSFLLGKAEAPVKVMKGRRDGERRLFLTLENPSQATALRNLDGIDFADGKLAIRYSNDTVSPTPGIGIHPINTGNTDTNTSALKDTKSPPASRLSFVDVLRAVVQTRYNVESKRLDLDRIHDDMIVKTEKLKVFDYMDPHSKLGSVLCKVIQEQCPGLETLSAAGNRLKTLLHFASLHERVPTLINVSFQDNLLNSYRDLESFNGKEFKHMRELVLIGNPVRERELAKNGGNITYTSNIKKLFPSIQLLDMQPVLEEIQFASAQTSGKLPFEVRPSFIDSENTQAAVQQFLQSYYTLFDTNRAGLLDFYSDQAIFSLSVNSVRVSRGRGAFQGSGNSQQLDRSFQAWWPFNRNLLRLKLPDKRVELTYVGATEIVRTLGQLPSTTHPITEPPEKKRFLIDAFQHGVPPAASLYIIVHGEFKEVDANVLRSFDRTFVIVPAVAGSRSAAMQLPFMIMNDTWVVRYHTGNHAWHHAVPAGVASVDAVTGVPPVSSSSSSTTTNHGQASVVPASMPIGLQQQQQQQVLTPWPWPQLPSDPSTLAQYCHQHGLTDDQHNTVIAFSQATGLNYGYSLQCLRETGWSQGVAGEAFMRAKSSIPDEAYRL